MEVQSASHKEKLKRSILAHARSYYNKTRTPKKVRVLEKRTLSRDFRDVPTIAHTLQSRQIGAGAPNAAVTALTIAASASVTTPS